MMLLPIHVIAAAVGIASGFVALYSRKGATLHRKSGMVFVYAMVTMGLSTSSLRAGAPLITTA